MRTGPSVAASVGRCTGCSRARPEGWSRGLGSSEGSLHEIDQLGRTAGSRGFLQRSTPGSGRGQGMVCTLRWGPWGAARQSQRSSAPVPESSSAGPV